MKCAVHSDVDASGYCRNCGKALCPQCTREVRGALYCEQCLAGLLAAPQPDPKEKTDGNPALAATLGFIPGLGAVYNGEYVKALIHVLIFGGLIATLSSDVPDGFKAFCGIALACFYFFMPIDAYRVARARRLGEPEPGPFAETQSKRPIGAIILIALGVLFLLSNFGLLEMDWVQKTWPIGLIVLGGWLVWDRMRKTS